MRRSIVLFISIIFIAINTIGQVLSPDALAGKIIFAFKTSDFDSFKKLMFDVIDYKELLNDYIKSNHIPETKQKDLAQREKHFADSADIHYKQEFDRLLNKGIKLGIDWTQIKKDTFVFELGTRVNSDKKSLSGHLNIKFKDTLYVIFGIEAEELSSGYKISDIRTILKGGIGQYFDPDLLDDADK
jgi:hypothetical protein